MRPTLKRLRWPTALLVSGTSLGPWAMRGASSTTQTGSRNQLWTVVMIDLGGGLGIESTELEEHDAPFGEIEPEGSFDDHSIVVSLDCQHRPDSEQQLLRQEPRRGIPLVDRVEPSSADGGGERLPAVTCASGRSTHTVVFSCTSPVPRCVFLPGVEEHAGAVPCFKRRTPFEAARHSRTRRRWGNLGPGQAAAWQTGMNEWDCCSETQGADSQQGLGCSPYLTTCRTASPTPRGVPGAGD